MVMEGRVKKVGKGGGRVRGDTNFIQTPIISTKSAKGSPSG